MQLSETVHLFRSILNPDGVPWAPPEDPTFGWSQDAARVEAYDIPGTHESMLHGEGVVLLAEHLRALLRGSERGEEG